MTVDSKDGALIQQEREGGRAARAAWYTDSQRPVEMRGGSMRVPDQLLGRTATACLALTLLLVGPPPAVAQFPMPIGPELRVNTYTTGVQDRPSVAAYQNDFVVVWESGGQDGDQSGIFGQRYDGFDATPLGTEFRVNSYTTGAQHAASAGSKWGQSFVIAWQSDGQDGDLGSIYAQRLSAGGVPLGGEFRVNSYTTSSQATPAVAADSAGKFVVVWASLGQDGSGYGIFGQRYGAGGMPLGAEFRVNTYTTGFQGNPVVGMTDEGHFVVAWEGESAGEDGFGILAQRYVNDGTPLGGEFRVNNFTTGDQRYPSVDCGGGQFAVVWQSEGQDGSGYGIYNRVFNLGSGAPGPEFRVNAFTTGSQTHPSVASNLWLNCGMTWSDEGQDPQGGIFAVSPYGCFPNGFSPTHVNTYTTGAQTGPVIAAGGPDYLLAVWTSEQDSDGSVGVYAQLLNPGWLPVELQDFTVE